jgi:hypothetical protein
MQQDMADSLCMPTAVTTREISGTCIEASYHVNL